MNKTNATLTRQLRSAFAAFQQQVGEILTQLEHANNIQSSTLPEYERAVELASAACHVSPEEIRSRRRGEETAWARHLAVYLLKKRSSYSMERIGKAFNRTHSAIINSISAVENRCSTDKRIKQQVEELLNAF